MKLTDSNYFLYFYNSLNFGVNPVQDGCQFMDLSLNISGYNSVNSTDIMVKFGVVIAEGHLQ